MPLDKATGVVSSFLKRVSSGCVPTIGDVSGKIYARILDRRIRLIVEPLI